MNYANGFDIFSLMHTFAPKSRENPTLKIFTSKQELSAYLSGIRERGKSIGFVPTMGALHRGHISLIERAKASTDAVVCSIFVNPTQFTDPADLEKYPRPLNDDILKLQIAQCDVLFLPEVLEMYSGSEVWSLDLGYIETILEGRFRPGHYKGVTQIVKKLFDAVKPDKSFFGQKDYQQVMVVRKLIDVYKLPIELVMCPISRDSDGLALSSRNVHLSEKERAQALSLSRALQLLKQNYGSRTVQLLKDEAKTYLNNSPGVELEYLELCQADTLLPFESSKGECVALVAARVGKIRLIDNIILK